ncbi:hypothetical protein [Ciceribacter sp. L1K22]|uniref:hypothetical protein n=1 Tax=Ciceribacter sp. L1K22 TaxID=2820275 RepID=UPI001ABDDE37|nr:hypothetical protein [Ciceribacter sp. L1K22]MBO3760382.1 hypothetical protein [Ciceribacter sp. L1K22]
MTLWTCTSCGAVERLTVIPDFCSFCGGTMETQDGRLTYPQRDDGVAAVLSEAHSGDVAAIIALWHDGHPLTSSMQEMLDREFTGLVCRNLEQTYRAEAA